VDALSGVRSESVTGRCDGNKDAVRCRSFAGMASTVMRSSGLSYRVFCSRILCSFDQCSSLSSNRGIENSCCYCMRALTIRVFFPITKPWIETSTGPRETSPVWGGRTIIQMRMSVNIIYRFAGVDSEKNFFAMHPHYYETMRSWSAFTLSPSSPFALSPCRLGICY